MIENSLKRIVIDESVQAVDFFSDFCGPLMDAVGDLRIERLPVEGVPQDGFRICFFDCRFWQGFGLHGMNPLSLFYRPKGEKGSSELSSVSESPVLIVGYLFCRDAKFDSARLPIAKRWVNARLPLIKMLREMVLSGDRSSLSLPGTPALVTTLKQPITKKSHSLR